MKNYIILLLLSVLSVNVYSQKEMKNKTITISAQSYNEDIASGVVLVDYWAPWCGPCRKLAPVLKEIAEETDVIVGKLNVENYKSFARKQNVSIIPTMIIYDEGKEVERLQGVYSKEELLEILHPYLNKKGNS